MRWATTRESRCQDGIKLHEETLALHIQKDIFPRKGDSISDWDAQGQGRIPTVGGAQERKASAALWLPWKEGMGGSQLGCHGLTGLLQGNVTSRCASVTRQPLCPAWWMATTASPCPEAGQKSARTERGQSLCAAGSWWRSSTMAGQSFPWLLPIVLLVILGRPLDTSSRPAGDPRSSAVLAEAPKQRDEARDSPLGTHAFLDVHRPGAAGDGCLPRLVAVQEAPETLGTGQGGRGSQAGGMVPGTGERSKASAQAGIGRFLRAPRED